jgi:hypothetical protein
MRLQWEYRATHLPAFARAVRFLHECFFHSLVDCFGVYAGEPPKLSIAPFKVSKEAARLAQEERKRAKDASKKRGDDIFRPNSKNPRSDPESRRTYTWE